jgi:hypothetical protein
MNILQTFKEIKKSPFKLPTWTQYIGKSQYGTPYFWPINFCSTIISIRRLKLRSEEDYQKRIEQRKPYIVSEGYKKEIRYLNLPMARRTKNWIINVFGQEFYIELGSPIAIDSTQLGWKHKYDTPRFEWAPSFKIFFFKWQYCIWLNSPGDARDEYWEMLLWYLYYADKDIKKAEQTWPWVNSKIKESTWNKSLLK